MSSHSDVHRLKAHDGDARITAAVVTGAASGIGRPLAARLAADGHKV